MAWSFYRSVDKCQELAKLPDMENEMHGALHQADAEEVKTTNGRGQLETSSPKCNFEQAVHLIRAEFNINHDVILRQLTPPEVFFQYGPEVSAFVFDLLTT